MTEEALKPFLNLRALVLLGSAGTLATLAALGFQTFAPVVNETYDGILDGAARVEAAMLEARRLSSMPRPQQATMWQQLAPVLVHNQRHLMCGGLSRVLTAYAREVLERALTGVTKSATHALTHARNRSHHSQHHTHHEARAATPTSSTGAPGSAHHA